MKRNIFLLLLFLIILPNLISACGSFLVPEIHSFWEKGELNYVLDMYTPGGSP